MGLCVLLNEGKIRGKILVELWATGRPMTLQRLAESVGLPSSSAMGYLLGLIKVKYVSVPQKHYYCITSKGKQAIGLPTLDKDSAKNIIAPVPTEKAFHFYYNIDHYSGIHANSLEDFVDKIQTINLTSINFHLSRKDFENWIRSLGEIELAKKIALIRTAKLSGENLRKKLYETVNSRYEELSKLAI